MLSTMETNEARESHLIAERAELAPWLDYPRSPWWYPPAGGAWAVAVGASASAEGWPQALLLPLMALAAGYFGWARRSWGTWPRLDSMPTEFRRPAGLFVGLVFAVTVGSTALLHVVDQTLSAVVLGLGVAAVLAWYEEAYAAASRRLASRLGTTSRVR